MAKKREFHSSELIKKLAILYNFDDVLISFRIRDFLQQYLDETLYNEIEKVVFKDNILQLKIKSPLLRNDFHMRKSFYIKKISDELELDINELYLI